MPHLSIIIPSYNYGLYIGEAINSVINQSYKDFEIIVIDDGSTDDTRENIETHYSNVVKYCYQDNKGPGAARNKGLKHVRGQFIVFLDADDYFLPGNLQTKINYIREHPDVDWLFSDVFFVDGKGKFLKRGSEYFDKIYCETNFPLDDIFIALLKHGNFISTASLVIRRKCFDSIPDFAEDLLMHQDYFQWLTLSKHFKSYAYIDRPLVAIRRHNASWGNHTKVSLEQRLKLYSKLEEYFIQDIRKFKRTWNKRFADAYNRLGIIELDRGSREVALEYFLKSLLKRPIQRFAYTSLFRCIRT
jgi:glycosyltransferase involved in cell wall biosynthesis